MPRTDTWSPCHRPDQGSETRNRLPALDQRPEGQALTVARLAPATR